MKPKQVLVVGSRADEVHYLDFISVDAVHQNISRAHQLPFCPAERMLGFGRATVGTMEGSMSKTGLDNRHRNKDGELSHKHGDTVIRTLRKIYGQSFAAGYPETEKLSEVLAQLNETSLSQLRRDHETGHLEHKIAKASK